MALLGQKHLVRFFVDSKVTRLGHTLAGAWVGLAFLAGEHRHNFVQRNIGFGVVFGLAADDQRCAGFVDQNRIYFVDDSVVQAALHAVSSLVHHVVAQVVKTKFVVGAIRNIGAVSGLLFFARHIGQVHTHAHA